jgi:putative membrane protein
MYIDICTIYLENSGQNIYMKTKGKIIFLAVFFALIIVLMSAGFLFSASCNGNKSRDAKEIAKELNDAKFEKLKDKKNADFLVNAAEMYLNGIGLARLAQNKGKQIDVKELGKMMQKMNTSALNSLNQLATEKTISIPATPTTKCLQTAEFLNKKSGHDFDEEYCDIMVANQKQTIHLFETIVAESSDMDIKVWAIKILPDLRKHLDYAITCQKKCAEM